MLDVMLDLIGAPGQIVLEGRFARSVLLAGTLASLRADQRVHVPRSGDEGAEEGGGHGVARGALRLLCPALEPPGTLQACEPLPIDLADYRAHWRAACDRLERAA